MFIRTQKWRSQSKPVFVININIQLTRQHNCYKRLYKQIHVVVFISATIIVYQTSLFLSDQPTLKILIEVVKKTNKKF